MADRDAADTPQVNPGYAAGQLAKALRASQEHPDHAARERAAEKVSKWLSVFSGLITGSLQAGSRTPVADTPPWATLEVVTGGFATGQLLAGGPLLVHERDRLAQLGGTLEADARQALNGYFLSDEGLAELTARLESGRYDVGVPEEGALLVVAWLARHGHADAARRLLDALGPYLSKLRFYPVPADRPRRFGARVSLANVGETVQTLQRVAPNPLILAQKESIEVWAPLYDKTVRLFLETVHGDPPRPAAEQSPRAARGQVAITGGQPCRIYPQGWRARAESLLGEYEHKRQNHRLCAAPDRPQGNFAILRGYLRRCLDAPQSLSDGDVARVRSILASYVARRGEPDSQQCQELRDRQRAQTRLPTFQSIAQVVAGRLTGQPQNEGLDDVAVATGPITSVEARQSKIEAGVPIPPSLVRKVERCLCDTVEVLVEKGIVTSGETLARVLPQMTSGLRAAGITEPALRQLYAAIYRAFRRRRSLLLLDLQSQVKIEELPWVAAIDEFRRESLSTRELARQTLEEIVVLTLVSFPQAIVPNKLLQELRALAKSAGVELPLLDELAADIFMGTFSEKFVAAARQAAGLLAGTFYERYYGIDYRQVAQLDSAAQGVKSWFGRGRAGRADEFARYCAQRAGVNAQLGSPAANGMVIEQQQIVTTQNLAVLYAGLRLETALRDRLDQMAEQCFAWICRRLQVRTDRWHARLIAVKNTAYAWRQMVFYLAMLPNDRRAAFVAWAQEHLGGQPNQFQQRFQPALQGLAWVSAGGSLDDPAAKEARARRFLGWSTSKHWLLEI